MKCHLYVFCTVKIQYSKYWFFNIDENKDIVNIGTGW